MLDVDSMAVSMKGKIVTGRAARSVCFAAGLAVALGASGCMGGSSDKKEGQAISPGAFRVEKAKEPEAAPTATTAAAAGKNEPVGAAVAGGDAGGAGSTPAPVAATSDRAAAGVSAPRAEVGGKPVAVQAAAPDPGRGVVAIVDKPPQLNQGAGAKGRDVLADCMVGQINGRPVFASEVLDPMEGQLRAAAKDVKTPAQAQEWVRNSAKAIKSVVELRVRDELLLGEARARLTPEARQGLLYFLQRIDQWASGQQGGSRVKAEEDIKQRTGEDYDKFLESQRDQTLIKELIKESVTPSVRVPWRKVERFYAENQSIINPPPRAVVRFVQVDAKNAEAVARVEKAVADEAEFKKVGESEINLLDRAHGGEAVRDITGSYGDIEWVGNPSLNKAAAGLEPGKWAGPVEVGPFKVWVRRGADVVSEPQTLEDAQLQIKALLLKSKENQEQSEFFAQLLGKGSFTPISSMTLELLVLAAQRHLPPEIASAVREANPLGPEAPTMERAPALPIIDDVNVKPPKGSGGSPPPAKAPEGGKPAVPAGETPAPGTAVAPK